MNCRAGRYAPSPTGPLHLGSLLAALGSYLQARAQGARWRLRIDDLDAARTLRAADRDILNTLARFGFRWDGPVMYQSMRAGAYKTALDRLRRCGYVFDCGCTRRQARQGPTGIEGPIYPGTCRAGLPPGRAARAVRFRAADRALAFNDAVQGVYRQNLAWDIGDFVLLRADGIVAYQLATVLDDAAQGVTDVVRGADLLSSTPRQICLHDALDLVPPAYAHLPLLVDAQGRKLSKSVGASALPADRRGAQLWRCLSLLGQRPPDSLHDATAQRILRWATDNWTLGQVPATRTLTLEQGD